MEKFNWNFKTSINIKLVLTFALYNDVTIQKNYDFYTEYLY